jgi:pilus assembly protein CpaC
MISIGKRRFSETRSFVSNLIAAIGFAATFVPLSVQGQTSAPAAPTRLSAIQLPRPLNGTDVFRKIEIEQGKSISVSTGYGVKRVSVGNPGIADVAVLGPRELQFVAGKVGATNVLVWGTDGRIQAVVDVHVGTAYSHIAAELRRVLENEEIELESAGDSVVLRGSVSDGLSLEHALSVTRAFLPVDDRDHVINLLEVGGGQQVMLEVVIAEMDRSIKRGMGTNFHTITGSDGSVFEFFNFLGNQASIDERAFAFDLDSFELQELSTVLELSKAVTLAGAGFGVGTGIYEFFFNLLESEGLAKVLAEPTLVARSGEQASFLSGGEVAIPVAQGGAFGSITIEYKPFGVGVSFTPTVLSPDQIHLQVSPEVSDVDFSLGTSVDGTVVPGFRTRRVSTAVELGDGQSFAIAGLLRDSMSELIDEYPVLGRIPVLGALFRSSSFQSDESELVIIVTPRIVKPLEPGPHPLPTDHFIEPSSFEFYLLGQLEARPEPEPHPEPPSHSSSMQSPKFGGIIGGAGHRISARPTKEEK